MNTLWSLLMQHWLAIVLVIGSLIAVYLVYKHWNELIYGGGK